MLVIIAGGGRTGTQLASLLLAQNHDVHLIDDRKDILARIHHELPTEVIFEGQATEPKFLEFVGIERADVMAAVTNNDADNLALCYLARDRYKVPRTIARVNNPRAAWLFDETFHVDVTVSQADILAGLIQEEMSLGDMTTLLKLRLGTYAVVEQRIQPRSRALGVEIKDMQLPEHCVIAAIVRNGEVIVPRGITTFQVDDDVLAVTDRRGAQELAERLAPP